MSVTSERFTDAIKLRERPAEVFDVGFTALTQPCPWPKAYGGDVVAAALSAAMRTVTDGKSVHSMHSYFMRPVEIGAEVTYEVEVLRDGRGYSTRQVRGIQNGKVAYVCFANFAQGAPGGDYQSPMPEGLPQPQDLPSSAEYLRDKSGGTMTDVSKEYWSFGRSFDMRHVPGPVYLTVDGASTPHQAIWVKPYDELRAVDGLSSEQVHAAALAFVCDYTILEPALRVLGAAWADDGLVTASLDHAMWFHRTADVNGWLLYAQEAVSAQRGRGLSMGRFFTPDGLLVATVLQEGMIQQAPVTTTAPDTGGVHS